VILATTVSSTPVASLRGPRDTPVFIAASYMPSHARAIYPNILLTVRRIYKVRLFRIGLRQIYPASDASVDAGPDDNSLAGASQVLRRLSHRSDYQAYPAGVLPASICVNALAILAGSTSSQQLDRWTI
jgi:hypothetical protein